MSENFDEKDIGENNSTAENVPEEEAVTVSTESDEMSSEPKRKKFSRLSGKKSRKNNSESAEELKSRLKTNFLIAIIVLVTLNIVCGFVFTLYFRHKTDITVQQAYEGFLKNFDDIVSDELKESISQKILKDYIREYYLPEDYVSIGLYVNNKARPATVEVLSGNTADPAIRATGVVLNSEGYILTNMHSITFSTDHIGGDINNPTHSVTYTVYPVINVLVYGDIEPYAVEVIDYDIEHDLAIIKFKNPPEELSPVLIGDSDFVKIGEETVVMGNTLGLGITVSLGSVMGAYNYQNTDMLQLDALTLEGNSGAGVYNPLGEMVGLVSFKISDLSETGSICYAVASNEILDYIATVNGKKAINITYTLSENIP